MLTVPRRRAGVYDVQHPNDVKLTFPEAGKPALEPWTSSELLKSISPYYRLMFESGPQETQPVATVPPSSPANPSSKAQAPPAKKPVIGNDPDSDAESDAFYHTRALKASAAGTVKQIEITEASYTTYKALLSWLHTGQIAFSPFAASYEHPADRQEYFAVQSRQQAYRPFPPRPSQFSSWPTCW